MNDKNFLVLGIGVIAIIALLFGVFTYQRVKDFEKVVTSEPQAAAGDVNRTARVHQIGLAAATNTCMVQNTDDRDRIISRVYLFLAGATTTNTDNRARYSFSIATTSPTGLTGTTTATTTNYIVRDQPMPTSTISTTGFYYSSTTGNTESPGLSIIWPKGTGLLFKFFDGVNGMGATTSAQTTGYCGAEYDLML